jgi:hypothetical protein
MAAECATTGMARLLQVSTCGFYMRVNRSVTTELTDQAQRKADLTVKINGHHRNSGGTYGSPRITRRPARCRRADLGEDRRQDHVRACRSRVHAGLIQEGGPALDEGRQLFERLQPTLPILLANLVTIGKVAVAYQPNIEQALVLLPQGTAMVQGIGVANMNTNQDYKGTYLDFNLNFNLPPVCATGFLPPQQQRAPTFEDYPDRPVGDLFCRVPQDSPFNARGARNYPCATVPGKRAPTVKMCEMTKSLCH